MMICDFQDQVAKTSWLLSLSVSLSLSNQLLWRKPCHEKPYDKIHLAGNGSFLPRDKSVSLETDPPDPGNLQMTIALAEPQLSYSWISLPWKL